MTRYRCLELKLHTSIVASALCGLRNDKYILYGFTSISNNLPQNNLMSQLKALKLEVLKVVQPSRLSRPGVQPVDQGARMSI